ncbi:hypothetical protein PVOR_10204 [Paenibacillus vortex V453]|uniref:Uncharacterized protein n=1 Tax=Paenibacillus vortex V453 TaxID=715225 RepID=A0A2R9SWX3_9BACL|nr:hypothetical protein PVOR_10204 [Paenibacillus vortex V453]
MINTRMSSLLPFMGQALFMPQQQASLHCFLINIM